MDAVIDKQFARVETALTTLIDSITTYNPSPAAAEALLSADTSLSASLDQLSVHQTQHARILALRTTAAQLEAQVKENLRALAETRHALLQVPATRFPDSARRVPVGELLQYAASISRYTVPPTYREELPRLEDAVGAANTSTTTAAGTPMAVDSGGDTAPAVTGGQTTTTLANKSIVGTPAVLTPSSATAMTFAPPPSASTKDDAEKEKEKEKDSSPQEAAWLRALQESGSQWTPWPNNDRTRTGNLMHVQQLAERGVDPTQVLAPEHLERMERERKAVEEEAERVARDRDEEEARERERMNRDGREKWERGQHQQPAPRVFEGLDMYEDDE